jgi:putative hydrolase of the HAD superfamily
MEPPAPRLAEALAIPEDDAERAFRAEIAYYVEHHLEGRDEPSLAALRDRCAEIIREALGLPSAEHARVRAAMLDSIRFSAFVDAGPALNELRARGLRLVVASNWDCSLPQVLQRAGLSEFVDAVVSSASVGAAKPEPGLFAAALGVARCAPDEALHVGDTPEADVAGAERAGVRAVLLDRELKWPDAPARIESLAELPGLI